MRVEKPIAMQEVEPHAFHPTSYELKNGIFDKKIS